MTAARPRSSGMASRIASRSAASTPSASSRRCLSVYNADRSFAICVGAEPVDRVRRQDDRFPRLDRGDDLVHHGSQTLTWPASVEATERCGCLITSARMTSRSPAASQSIRCLIFSVEGMQVHVFDPLAVNLVVRDVGELRLRLGHVEDALGEVENADPVRRADVEDLARDRALVHERGKRAHRVGDVAEAARLRAVAVDLERPARQRALDETRDHHPVLAALSRPPTVLKSRTMDSVQPRSRW